MSARALRPVVVERPADLTTPVALMKALLAGDGPCFLLESVEGGDRVARWSFLGAAPSGEISGAAGDPFALLKALPGAALAGRRDDLPPFTGGAVGYAGYDAVRRLEKLPATNPDPIGLPDAWFGIFDSVIAFDHAKHRLLFVTHAGRGRGRGEKSLRKVKRARGAAAAHGARRRGPPPRPLLPSRKLFRVSSYIAAVEKAKEHIRAGDVFQVVLSRRWSAPFEGDPFAVYRALRSISPSPYQYFLRTPHGTIFGASPERLVRVAASPGGAAVETIPLAGTRPRGATREEDLALEKDLLADAKERAEHVMLVDLGRNDLGRGRGPGHGPREGLLRGRALLARHAHRLAGRRDPRGGRHAVDALAATFPAGTLTGAPKIRAMEIIEDLEPVRRGAYGGAVGYLDFAGNLDVAIAIRTAVVANGVLHVQAGAGIVADSRRRVRGSASARTRRGPSCAPSRGRGSSRDPRRRQLRLLHVQPRPDPRDARRRRRRRPERRLHRGRDRSRRRPTASSSRRDPAVPRTRGSLRAHRRDTDIPLLGVCLGHQALGAVFGGAVVAGADPHAREDLRDRARRARTLRGPPEPVHGDALPLARRGGGLGPGRAARSRRRPPTGS